MDTLGDLRTALETARELAGLPQRLPVEVKRVELGGPALLPPWPRPAAGSRPSGTGSFLEERLGAMLRLAGLEDPFDRLWLERALLRPEPAWAVAGIHRILAGGGSGR